MVIDGYNLTMTRGDTEYFTVNVFDGEEEYILKDGDVLRFTVRTSLRSDIVIIEKVSTDFYNNETRFNIDSMDTKNLERGKYVYDVELTKADGTVTTIIPPATEIAYLVLGGDVSRG